MPVEGGYPIPTPIAECANCHEPLYPGWPLIALDCPHRCTPGACQPTSICFIKDALHVGCAATPIGAEGVVDAA